MPSAKSSYSKTICVSGVTGRLSPLTDGKYRHSITDPCKPFHGAIAVARLPIATASAVGGVKGGGNVSIAADGTMSASISGSGITVTARSGLGNNTNLDSVLNYISNVFLGTQTINKIKAGTFDTTS
jgi:hypothetical protein